MPRTALLNARVAARLGYYLPDWMPSDEYPAGRSPTAPCNRPAPYIDEATTSATLARDFADLPPFLRRYVLMQLSNPRMTDCNIAFGAKSLVYECFHPLDGGCVDIETEVFKPVYIATNTGSARVGQLLSLSPQSVSLLNQFPSTYTQQQTLQTQTQTQSPDQTQTLDQTQTQNAPSLSYQSPQVYEQPAATPVESLTPQSVSLLNQLPSTYTQQQTLQAPSLSYQSPQVYEQPMAPAQQAPSLSYQSPQVYEQPMATPAETLTPQAVNLLNAPPDGGFNPVDGSYKYLSNSNEVVNLSGEPVFNPNPYTALAPEQSAPINSYSEPTPEPTYTYQQPTQDTFFAQPTPPSNVYTEPTPEPTYTYQQPSQDTFYAQPTPPSNVYTEPPAYSTQQAPPNQFAPPPDQSPPPPPDQMPPPPPDQMPPPDQYTPPPPPGSYIPPGSYTPPGSSYRQGQGARVTAPPGYVYPPFVPTPRPPNYRTGIPRPPRQYPWCYPCAARRLWIIAHEIANGRSADIVAIANHLLTHG